jgi:hypothetical protein
VVKHRLLKPQMICHKVRRVLLQISNALQSQQLAHHHKENKMTFFYDMNKKLADLAAKQTLNESAVAEAGYSAKSARAGHDIGKPGKNFAKIAKGAAERYGSKAAGERVAGAVLNKLRHPKEDMDESAFQAAIGKKKYGDEGMKALQKAGRDHASAKTMSNIRNKYDKYDESMGQTDEGNAFSGAVAKARADGVQPGEKIRVGGKTYPVKETGPMTPKQKSFAKLAPPTDKITFADKIAGAKKEVDEMLGDVAANAIKGALSGKKNGDMEETKTRKIAGNRYGGAKQVDKPEHDDAPRGKAKAGRPEGDQLKADFSAFGIGKPVKLAKHKGAVTKHELSDKTPAKGQAADAAFKASEKAAKGVKKVKESPGVDITDQGEYDQEGGMAKDNIHTIVRHARALEKILGDNDNLPEWVQSKLAKIEGMMTAVDDYMQDQKERAVEKDTGEEGVELDEKAVSKKQQRFMGMVHATQKGEKAPSKEVGKVAKTMKKKDAEDFASTKHKGLPEKVGKKKKEVEETTTSGAVATGGSGGSKGGVYGKGIYDSINREVEAMIAESMSINMSMNSDASQGGASKTLTVTATDQDAEQLAQMLSNAGMAAQGVSSSEEMHAHDHDHDDTCNECGMTYESCGCDHVEEGTCPTCGMQDCSCGDIEEALDENNPDWPTEPTGQEDNINYYDTDGLNGRKTTGQTTIPVVASQGDRQQAYEDEDLARMMEMAGLTSEGFGDIARKVGDVAKKVGGKVLDKLGHEDDVLKDLQQKAGIPAHAQHGKPNMAYPKDEKRLEEADKPNKDLEESLMRQLANFKK